MSHELRALLRLASPIVAAFVGSQLMGFVDTAMVGRLGEAAIGGVGIGGSIYMTLGMVAMGLALGADPLLSQAVGAGEQGRARRILWQAVRVAGLASLPMLALILIAPLGLGPAKVEAETARATREFLWGRAWGVIPMAMFGATRAYIQAVGATRAIVVATIVGNIVNFFGDAILIYGDGALEYVGLPGIGLPALGVFGAGLSSTLATIVMFGVVASAARAVPTPLDPDRRRRDPELIRRIVRVGTPIALQMVVEISAFGAASVLSGRIGRTDAAANQLALQLASFTFMVPLGVATATAVRVGYAIGRQDTPGARRAAACGLGVSLSFMACAAIAFIAAPAALAGVLTNKVHAIAMAVPLIQIAAVFQLSDGTQVTAAGALRGVGDTRSTFWANLIGHFGFGVPLAVILAFPLGMGTRGLWWGLSVGLTVVGLSLTWRFFRVTSREVKRLEA